MVRTNTIDYGIDLGTSTSSVAKLEGNYTSVVPNLKDNSMNYTPSAVYIQNKKGKETINVGLKAKNMLLIKPNDAYSEFKLTMGEKKPYHFKQADKDMLPEELSAEVLKSLKGDVSNIKGENLSSIVITVPADFNQNKIQATKRAADLAGFKECHLLKEPSTAALAYAYESTEEDDGFWMIYDLGGGTFDVAIVKKIDDEFDIIANVGDESLGGKLIDWDIVDKIFVPAVVEEFGVSDFSRKNIDKYNREFAMLKSHAEEAKVNLSNEMEYNVLIDRFMEDEDGDLVEFDYDITRMQLEKIMEPYIRTTINSCNDALNKAGLAPSDIKKLILVGGSTLSPVIRESLEKEFCMPLDFSIDPITVVARGAAIAAGNIQKSYDDEEIEIQSGEYFVQLEYETMGSDDEFFVIYNVKPPEGETLDGCYIEFRNTKSGYSSGKIPLNESSGEVDLLAEFENEDNYFAIELTNSDGEILKIAPSSPDTVKYKIAVDSLVPTLLQDVGLGLADNSLYLYAQEGTSLPYTFTRSFSTTGTIRKGSQDSVWLPLYEGNKDKADKNKLIGEFLITEKDIPRDLPKGSEIEITIDIDESSIFTFTAVITMFDKILEQTLNVDFKPEIDMADLTNLFEQEKSRFYDLKCKYNSSNSNVKVDEYFAKIDEQNMIERISSLLDAASNDVSSLSAADKEIKEFGYYLDLIEDILSKESSFKETSNEINMLLDDVGSTVHEKGSLQQETIFNELKNQVNNAQANQDVDSLEIIKEELYNLRFDLNKMEVVLSVFFDLKNNGLFFNSQYEADMLINQGDNLIQNAGYSENIANQLMSITSRLLELDQRRRDEIPDEVSRFGVELR